MYLVSLNRAMVWYLKSSVFASTFKIRTLRRSATKSIDEQTDLGYLSSLKKGGGQVDQACVYLLGRPMVPWQSNQWCGSRQGVTMPAERTALCVRSSPTSYVFLKPNSHCPMLCLPMLEEPHEVYCHA